MGLTYTLKERRIVHQFGLGLVEELIFLLSLIFLFMTLNGIIFAKNTCIKLKLES